jgi:hypothetical protein
MEKLKSTDALEVLDGLGDIFKQSQQTPERDIAAAQIAAFNRVAEAVERFCKITEDMQAAADKLNEVTQSISGNS